MDTKLLIRHAILQYLQENGHSQTIAHFQQECPLSAPSDDAALPRMHDLVQTWLSRQQTLSELSKPVASTTLHIPAKSSVTLDRIHATNILTLTYHDLKRRRFDTTLADYVDDVIPCLVSSAADRTIRFTNVLTADVEEALTPSASVVLSVAIDAQRQQIACGSMDGSLHMVDLATSDVLFKTKDHSKYVVKVVLSDDGMWLATASYDKTICLYQRTDKTWVKRHIHKLDSNPEALHFLPDASSLVFTRREDYRLNYLTLTEPGFPVVSFNLNERLDAHISFTIMHIARHPTQPLLSLQTDSNQSQIFIVPFSSGERLTTLYTTASHTEYSTPRHAWFPDGSAVAVNSDDGRIWVCSPTDGRTLQTIRAHGISDAELAQRSSKEEIRERLKRDQGSSNIRDLCVYQGLEGPVVASCSYDKTIRLTQCRVLEGVADVQGTAA